MKYRFLLVSALLSSVTVFGQSSLQKIKAGVERSEVREVASEPGQKSEHPSKTQQILSDEEGTVIMYEDFANGIP